MKRLLLVTAVALIAFPSRADYAVTNRGTWPETWPKELEPLRTQARTLRGPLQPLLHYAIPFKHRDDFEAAWPHVLKVKSTGAPIVLRRGSSFWLDGAKHGVCIHTPPAGQQPIEAAPGEKRPRWQDTIYIELVVDGEIVDLNRIFLPPDTPVIDERFKSAEK